MKLMDVERVAVGEWLEECKETMQQRGKVKSA